MAKTIKVKTESQFFFSASVGDKPFEVRKDDRPYEVGDILEQYEYRNGKVTGWCIRQEICYLLRGTKWGIKTGYVVIGLRKPSQPIFRPQVTL